MGASVPPSFSIMQYVNEPTEMDCRKFISLIPDNSIDLLIADPPYDLGYWEYIEGWIELVKSKLAPNGSLYVFCGIGEQSDSLSRILPVIKRHFTFKNLITWKKQRGYGTQRNWMYTREEIIFAINGPEYVFYPQRTAEKHVAGYERGWAANKGKYPPLSEYKRATNVWTDILEITPGVGNSPEYTGHPTQKPLRLIERMILASSNEGDMILDPFGGVFTTMVAAIQLRRQCLSCDIDPKWVKVGRQRVRNAQIKAL